MDKLGDGLISLPTGRLGPWAGGVFGGDCRRARIGLLRRAALRGWAAANGEDLFPAHAIAVRLAIARTALAATAFAGGQARVAARSGQFGRHGGGHDKARVEVRPAGKLSAEQGGGDKANAHQTDAHITDETADPLQHAQMMKATARIATNIRWRSATIPVELDPGVPSSSGPTRLRAAWRAVAHAPADPVGSGRRAPSGRFASGGFPALGRAR